MGEPYVSQVPASRMVHGLKTASDLGAKVFAPVPLRSRWIAPRVKRILDVALAVLLLFLTFPLLIVIALLVALDGGPVLYRHRRIGLGGAGFECLKFRTMILDAEQSLEEYLSYHPEARNEWKQYGKLSFDPRITKIGNFLRSSSLDELPQFLNVIKGDMSLVGPRPVTQGELSLYGSSASLYKSVRPGITGVWQIGGRNDVGYETRVSLDERYVKDWSLGLDLRILLRTPAAVLSRRGAR